MKTLWYLFKSLRPHQWTKNGFIFLPLIFSQKAFDIPSLIRIFETVIIFCIMTGAIYILNDIFDLAADRNHPSKRFRPLAAGLISKKVSFFSAIVILSISIIWAALVHINLFFILMIYIFIQIIYNYRLKKVVILDIFCISFGFFLRVIAGAEVIDVLPSNWLIICTVLISLFVAMGKRRYEIMALNPKEAVNHREVLSHYSPYLLDQMISVITGGIVVSYMLYCISAETIARFNTNRLIYTFPFVLYGIFRYLYLIHEKKQGGEPERVIISDISLLLTVLLWGLSCVIIIYV